MRMSFRSHWRRLCLAFTACVALCFFITGCGAGPGKYDDAYRNVYEIFVGSFYDSDGDGMGDLNGVTEKLDYIADPDTGLGADAIWMMPIMPSPTYHKYDVTDYYAIDPAYGSLEDFEALERECERRGVRLIIDLVLNHTSSEHPWFKEALAELRDKKEPHYVNYYNFTKEKPSSSWYAAPDGHFYEAGFWNEMPDLNMDNEELRQEIVNIAKFWLDKGVDGFRLDAAKHVYNVPDDNISFWTWFADECKKINPDVYLVAEVWDNDTVVMPYYETGLTSMFNFAFSGADGVIATNIKKGVGQDIASQIERYEKLIDMRDENAINALFLSNHDSDRSAGYFNGDEELMKLSAAVYMLIPGNSYIYYGEEIGLTGNGRDENKRAPMVWALNDDTGKTRGPVMMSQRPKMDEGAAEQLARENSLLNYYRKLIALKNKYPAIARGTPELVRTSERAVCAYKITFEGRAYLIAHNVTAEAVTVTLPEMTDVKAMKITEKMCALTNSADDGEFTVSNGELTLPGYGTVLIELE